MSFGTNLLFTGGKLTRPLIFADGTTQTTAAGAGGGSYLPLTGGTLTGNLNVDARPAGTEGSWSQVQSGLFGVTNTVSGSSTYFDTTGLYLSNNTGAISTLTPEKLSFVNTSTTAASLNLKTGVTPTASVAGDIWISSGAIRYKDVGGIERIVADTNRSNTYTTNNTFQNNTSNPTVTVTASGSGTALKVTNTGTGESLRVEDDTSPDATPFVISNSGRVGIGVAPDATAALSIDGTGIKFPNVLLLPDRVITTPAGAVYAKELLITISGTNYAIALRVV